MIARRTRTPSSRRFRDAHGPTRCWPRHQLVVRSRWRCMGATGSTPHAIASNAERAWARANDCLSRARLAADAVLAANPDPGANAATWRNLGSLVAESGMPMGADCTADFEAAGARLDVNAADSAQCVAVRHHASGFGCDERRDDRLPRAAPLDWRGDDGLRTRTSGAESDWYAGGQTGSRRETGHSPTCTSCIAFAASRMPSASIRSSPPNPAASQSTQRVEKCSQPSPDSRTKSSLASSIFAPAACRSPTSSPSQECYPPPRLKRSSRDTKTFRRHRDSRPRRMDRHSVGRGGISDDPLKASRCALSTPRYAAVTSFASERGRSDGSHRALDRSRRIAHRVAQCAARTSRGPASHSLAIRSRWLFKSAR